MDNFDITYLSRTIGNLIGIPIRLYENNNLIYFYSTIQFPVDPISPYEKDIIKIESHVSYYVTPYFNYYGIVSSGNLKLVIGPTRQILNSDQQLKEMAFSSGVSRETIDDFICGMKNIVPMPLESILEILCAINHILNGEKLELKDISIIELEQNTITDSLEKQNVQSSFINEKSEIYPHNTFRIEQNLQSMVTSGDTKTLKEWISKAQAIRGGTVAFDQMRQLKNMFIVVATLTSRAAIKGGMDVSDALALSDVYIQQSELTNSISSITNLQYHMIMDYTGQVEKLKHGLEQNQLVIDITNYIHHNISSPITTSDIASYLKISRTHLSKKFHSIMGITLIDFIHQEKISEAKRLLKYSNRPVVDISNYLCFSSQSHFTRIFKQYTKLSPKEYRNQEYKV